MYINVIRKKVSFFLGFLTVLILFSCVPASDVPLPTEEEIKNDLLNEKLGNWTFSKLEEFNTVTIVNKNHFYRSGQQPGQPNPKETFRH